jgi:hypothetical protein
MEKLLWSIAGQVDEFDAVVSGDEFKDRKDAESIFEVMIPKGFEANDILFVTFC